MVKPMKTTLLELQSHLEQLGSAVHQMGQTTEEMVETSDMCELVDEEHTENAEYVTEVLEELNHSLDSGEIDVEQYGSSLRYALGTDGRVLPVPKMAPLMTSTPISKQSRPIPSVKTRNAPIVSTPPLVEKKTSSTPPSQVVYEKTPIKRPSTSSFGMAFPLLSTRITTPSAAVIATAAPNSTMVIAAAQIENVQKSENSGVSVRRMDSNKKDTKIQSTDVLALMETIVPEEKANVQLWLGLDIHELNRAIPILNEYISHKRIDITTATSKEVSFTVEEVASQCDVQAKKAKAIVLLLCNLKRLLFVGGYTTAYSLLAGNTLPKN
jgi:hypothetical protein